MCTMPKVFPSPLSQNKRINIKDTKCCLYSTDGRLLNTNKRSVNKRSVKGPMLETLDHTIRIGSTPTFLYFDLY